LGKYKFHDLEPLLESLSTVENEQTIKANASFLDDVARPQNIIPLLQEVLNQRSLLTEVAGRSYPHINLFDKIVLVGTDAIYGYRLTLHIWNPPFSESEIQAELIHDHRFSLWSAILAGTQTSVDYAEASDAGKSYREYRYIPEKRPEHFIDFYEFRGEKRLREIKTHARTAGSSYFLGVPSVHTVLLPSSLTCSLVLRGPRQREYANIYNTRYPEENAAFDNSMFSPLVLKTKLESLLAVLSARMVGPRAHVNSSPTPG